MFDPYSSCPCGSGKKFKWCCQPIHAALGKVFQLDEEGQHEAALRLMDEVVAQHPTNPEVWGRKALLLFQNEKPEDAEKTLDKAFELQPNYPFGFFLKGKFRIFEGEIAGALMLFRKSAEQYDPAAKEILAQLYVEIFDCEMKMNHPIAAHAAAQQAARLNPANENLRQGITTVFGAQNPNLPASAIYLYTFKPLPAGASVERRAAWEAALQAGTTGRLTDATRACEQLTQAEGTEPAAWYNLALCHAWNGNNVAAVAALDRYVALEADEAEAVKAWTLAEVLRLGVDMIPHSDLIEYSIVAALRDPNAFVAVLGDLEREGLLTGAQVNEQEGVLTAMILEPAGPALTPELQAQQGPKLGAYIFIAGNVARLWSVNRDTLVSAFNRFGQKAGKAIAQAQETRGPGKFIEALSEGITFARNPATKEEAEARMREGFVKFYEEKWVHRPLHSLGGVAPAEAARQPSLRKKLRGVVEFLRECCTLVRFPYDFDRLANQLGLLGPAPAANITAAPSAVAAPADISTMGVSQLTGLQTESLSPADLDRAYQAALKFDARDLAGKFAADLVRPPYPERPDRFVLFQLLINQSLAAGAPTAALDRLNEGEKDDCENNGGKRRNDYELRRAQLHAKGGEFDEAEQVFDRLIARVPSELNVRISAAETMLSARQGARAQKYAQQGLAEALKANNRDLESHFKELLAASQK